MTVVTGVASGSNNNFDATDLSAFASASLSGASSTQFTLSGDGVTITCYGSGFSFSGGAPSGGTITSLTIASTNSLVTAQSWSSFSVSAASAWSDIVSANVTAFENLFFGGSDTFNSANTSGSDSFNAYGGSGTFNMQGSTSFFGDYLVGGTGGNNVFNFAGNLTNNTTIIGGAGVTNTINLDGNYSTPYYGTLGNASNIQVVNLTAGFSYVLGLGGQMDPGTQTTTINGGTLGASDALTVTDYWGTGNIVINGGAGNDTFYSQGGSGTATFDGGSGFNQVIFPDAYASYGITYNADGSVTVHDPAGGTETLKHVQQFVFANGFTVPVGNNQPWIESVASSVASGADLNAGKTISFTVDFNEAVTVNTGGGAPTLTLNDGGAATYTSGSGTNALTFSYVVQPGDGSYDLQVTGLSVPSGSAIENGGVEAAGTNAKEDTGIIINTLTPQADNQQYQWPNGNAYDASYGQVVTITVVMNEAVTVNTAGGLPTLTLNDGGTATYSGGSGSKDLTFSYTVGREDYTTSLLVTGLNMPSGSSMVDAAGNVAVFSTNTIQWEQSSQQYLVVNGTSPTDFNDDGNSDFLWQNTDGSLAIWAMSGTNVLSISPLGDPGPSWHVVSTGQFFRQADADLLFQNDDGTVAMWQMTGATIGYTNIVGSNPGPTWHVVGTGNFNGLDVSNNGTSQILFQNNNGTVALWTVVGVNVVSSGSIADPGPTWHVEGVGDFNDDGYADIVFQNDNGTVAIWEMNGYNIISSAAVANPGTSWHVVGVGDFNGDGKSDILFQNTSGTIAIWEMNGTSIAQSGAVLDPGPTWKVAGVGDFNGDGKSDILFQNTDGQEAIWEMNGFTIIASSGVSGDPGPTWQLQGDGGAPYQIGSGFTIPLSGSATSSGRGSAASLSAGESLTAMNQSFRHNAPALPMPMGSHAA